MSSAPQDSPSSAKKRKVDADNGPDSTVDELAPEQGTSTTAPAKRGPGRPRKNPVTPTVAAAGGETPPKRKRGRPPRPRTAEELAAMAAKAAMPKRPRGRPRKVRPEEQAAQQQAATAAAAAAATTSIAPSTLAGTSTNA
ncbi:hypothetical protein DL93DRAFT_2164264 [Clavulina sp. PMI_390]|nr:hypothetical protein DL93DRAFT_2164264 [Clavulina sp. PMI_390]